MTGKKSRRRNKENREGVLPELLDWGAPDQKKVSVFLDELIEQFFPSISI